VQGYFLWEAADGELSILVRRSVLQRLKMFAEEALSGARTETGGMLIGRSEDLIESGQRVITIERFESGMSPLPDDVVGFARFRRQMALHLNDADFLALRASLGLVSLMVRPDGKGGAVGGFFYRKGKTVRYPTMHMQFPIDAGAGDCRASVRPTLEGTYPETAPSRAKRLLYAIVGLALMLASFAIWLTGRS
jgi:hypothetical protein